MRAFLRAFGGGLHMVFVASTALAIGPLLLWWVATGEATGLAVLVLVPVGILMILSGIGFTAMIGAAMEEWMNG